MSCIFLFSNTASAADFKGMLPEFEIMLATFAFIMLAISAFIPSNTINGFLFPLISAILWVFSALGANKIMYPYVTDSAGIDFWYSYDFNILTLLFGMLGFFSFMFAIMRYVNFSAEALSRKSPSSEEYWNSY